MKTTTRERERSGSGTCSAELAAVDALAARAGRSPANLSAQPSRRPTAAADDPAPARPRRRRSRVLLRRTIDTYRDEPAGLGWLQHHLARLDEPLRVAIAGKVKAGKSTLLNALVGEEIAPTDAGECTRVVTWYRDAPAPRITLHPHGRRRRGSCRSAGTSGALTLDLARHARRATSTGSTSTGRRRACAHQTLIDTPGIASLSTDTSARTGAFLAPDDAPSPADAVIYLMRHLHADDVRLPRGLPRPGAATATPVNTDRRAVPGRRDRRRPARRAALGRGHRPPLPRRRQGPRRCARPSCRWPACSPRPGARCARRSSGARRAGRRGPRADVDAMLLSADRFAAAVRRRHRSCRRGGAPR